MTMIWKPFLTTNITKLSFAFTSDGITATNSLYSLSTVRTNLHIQVFNKLKWIFRYFFPVFQIMAITKAMGLFSTSRANHIATVIALDNSKHFFNHKTFVAIDSLFSLTNFDWWAIFCIRTAKNIDKKIIKSRIPLCKISAKHRRYFYWTVKIKAWRERFSVIASESKLYMFFPALFAKFFSTKPFNNKSILTTRMA